ncbi:MAG: hypothetical protein NTZ78_05855 [Candidatus Aureabacteria bacterium]|nr:hypothetical protein [Candidatus Auribacterota bacterium]
MKISTAVAAAILVSIAGGGIHAKEQKEHAVAKLPKGLAMEIMLESSLDSRTSREGQPVRARLSAPILVEGRIVVPSGTALAGKVTKVTGPQMGVTKAKIEFMFNEMKTPHGAVPIAATAHIDLQALAMKGGKAAGEMAAKEVAKSFIPVLGTVYLIQNVAKGVQFVTEEKEITIPQGTRMKIHLDKDATVPL